MVESRNPAIVKPPSPLLGFNNNVRHKGRVFHIQTEDSGIRHPHIITHLFADGGRILKTIKTSYAEYIDSPNMGEVVRQMMQDQHKGMFMALRDGQFDQLLEELQSRGAPTKSSPGASNAAMPAVLPPGKAAPELPVPAKTAPEPPAAAKAPPAAIPPPVRPPTMPPPPPARSPTIPPPMPAALRQVVRSPEPVAKAPDAIAPKAPEPPGKLTLEALDLAPAAAKRPPDPVPATPVPISPGLRTPAVSAPVVVPPAPPISPAALAARESAPPEPTPPPRAPSGESAPAPRAGQPATSPTTRIRVPAPQARPVLAIDPAAIHRVAPPSAAPSGATLKSVVEATVDSGPNIDLDTLERAAAEAETPLFQQIHDLPPPPAAVLGTRPPGTVGGYSSVSAPAPAPVSVPVPPAAPPSTRGRYAPSRPSSIFSSARPQEGSSIFGEDLISEKSLDEVILSYLAEDLDGPGEKK